MFRILKLGLVYDTESAQVIQVVKSECKSRYHSHRDLQELDFSIFTSWKPLLLSKTRSNQLPVFMILLQDLGIFLSQYFTPIS